MKDLQEATERICELKGELMATHALMNALLRVLPPVAWRVIEAQLQHEAEAARAVLLGALVSEHTIAAFERDVQRWSAKLDDLDQEQPDT